ncbi:enolase C-terminal domain-like protein [Microbacterium murale]|uniref:Mandelate racemase n=1 Tax=Microbacterium murale TaxID=1081040 RepID=A0ABQ1RGE6_9MICO|nr:enolase C-terminal domain-like protein [Microbacterium murale]GGD69561.1 mandelate racemase [Microbacterium murale]
MTDATIDTVTITMFDTLARTFRDSHGHDHPSEEPFAVVAALLTIVDSDGASGHTIVQGDYLRESVVTDYVRPALVGRDPLRRERIWHDLYLAQRGSYGRLHDRALTFVDQALWDLAGRKLGVPVWKLVGGYRDSVPAYASTMCGDEVPGGLSSPDDYAAFAVSLVEKGYKGVKLHTWMPPVSFAPDAKIDIRACAAVREAVGPDIALMLDSNHWYSRSDALYLARELEKLDFAWMEEPMDEYSMSSYKWLQARTDMAIAGPESVEGKFRSRAEWAASGAVDMLRIGVGSAGGITPALKVCSLADAFGMDCEIHGGGPGNLAVLAGSHNSRWYEAGLLHPHLDSVTPAPHLLSVIDAIDADGLVHMPTEPGLGESIDLEYIAAHVRDER